MTNLEQALRNWRATGPLYTSEAGAQAGFAAGYSASEELYRPFLEALRDRYNTDDRLGGLGDWLITLIGPGNTTK